MLTIVCGEDVFKARDVYKEFILSKKKEGFEIQQIRTEQIEEILKNSSGVVNLFGMKIIYTTEYVSKKYKGIAKTPYKEAVKSIAKDAEINLISWEGGNSAYELSSLVKIATKTFESKPSQSIFELLDNLSPGKLKNFLNCLNTVADTSEDLFIYTMLKQHLRKLHHLSVGSEAIKIQPWQKLKLRNQIRLWDPDKLRFFYQKFLSIELSTRTGATAYTYLDSIRLLVCYYLR